MMAAWLGHAEATRRMAQQNYEDRPAEALLNVAIPESNPAHGGEHVYELL